jgi:hypothetical protein
VEHAHIPLEITFWGVEEVLVQVNIILPGSCQLWRNVVDCGGVINLQALH